MAQRKRKAVIIDWTLPELHLYHIADAHVGRDACREWQIKTVADKIASDKYACVLGGGDYIEGITPSDWRWDAKDLIEPITSEYLESPVYCEALRFAKLFEPTRGKWAGLVVGNHEMTAIRNYFMNPGSIIAERLATRYVGETDQCSWFLFRLKGSGRVRHTVKVFVIHGWGGGELAGGLALKLQRLLWRKAATVLFMSHYHRPTYLHETVESVDSRGNEVKEDRIGIAGYAFAGKHGYMARKGGNENPAGYGVVKLRWDTRKVTMGVTMEVL